MSYLDGGVCNFYIKAKFLQHVVEGEPFFALHSYEWVKYYLKSVFMGKKATQWLLDNIKQTVLGSNPKRFFTFREGDIAFTLMVFKYFWKVYC